VKAGLQALVSSLAPFRGDLPIPGRHGKAALPAEPAIQPQNILGFDIPGSISDIPVHET